MSLAFVIRMHDRVRPYKAAREFIGRIQQKQFKAFVIKTMVIALNCIANRLYIFKDNLIVSKMSRRKLIDIVNIISLLD